MNSRSITLKRNELITYVSSEMVDIIGTKESWLNFNDKRLSVEITIPGYKVFEKCGTDEAGEEFYNDIKDNLQSI